MTSSDSTLNQELTNGTDVESTTFLLGGDADGYTVDWSNGEPEGISITPVSEALFGTSTLTLSGELDTGNTTTTIYYYTITAYEGQEEGSSISGSIIVHPDEVISLTPPNEVSYCATDNILLSYQFEGFRSLSVSSTSSSTISTLGILSSLTYSTTPSVEITVVASATSLGEVYQIEIVEENGNPNAIFYQTTSATETIDSIAAGLAAKIDADSSVSASSTGAVITIEAISTNYVFWTRINVGSSPGTMETYEDSRMLVTGAIPVTGEFTVTGTPTVSITETTSYSLIVVTPGIRSGTDATSATTVITLEPEQIITLTSSVSTLNQVLCDNTAIEDVVLQLDGSATGFTGLIWTGSNGTPGGILQPTVTASNTITLTGTITTGAWQASPITSAYGGTGLTSHGSSGQIMVSTGSGFQMQNIDGGTYS